MRMRCRGASHYRQTWLAPASCSWSTSWSCSRSRVTAVAQLWVSPPSGLEGGTAVHTVLAAGCTLPLLLRRRYAVAVFATVVASAWVQLELGGGLGQPFFAVAIALYAVGAHASRPWTFAGPAAVALQVLADVPRLRDGAPLDEVVPAWFILLGLWGFGRWMRHRARAAAALSERAEAAERDRREEAERAVAEERARIARELHDLVAHSMGVIVIQAQGAQRAMDTSPDQAREALSAIETAGRSGLAEMRRLLGLLTDDDADAGTAPQPTLDEIPDLVAQLQERRDAGRPARRGHRPGAAGRARADRLPGGAGGDDQRLEACRAGAGRREAALRAGVAGHRGHRRRATADGTSSVNGHDSGSRGLVGMRERVALYGGSLHTGPRPGGGFSVHARLPFESGPT